MTLETKLNETLSKMLYINEQHINQPMFVWKYSIGQKEYRTLDLTQIIKTDLRSVSLRTKVFNSAE